MSNTTESNCTEALRQAKEELGESPSKSQYEELDISPCASTIERICGGWNKAKNMANMKTVEEGSGSADPLPKPDDVELPDERTWEELPPATRYYYRNREEELDRLKEKRHQRRQWYMELKKKKGCKRCEENHPYCLDFHHVDGKEENVSIMVRQGRSKEAILDEVSNCVLLCANCHRKEHAPVSW